MGKADHIRRKGLSSSARPIILAAIVPDDCFAYTPSMEISEAKDYRDVGDRERKARVILAVIVPDDCFAYTPSLEISEANDYRDVGGRKRRVRVILSEAKNLCQRKHRFFGPLRFAQGPSRRRSRTSLCFAA